MRPPRGRRPVAAQEAGVSTRQPESGRDSVVSPVEPLARLKEGAPPGSLPGDVMALQRSVGNRAVQRLVDLSPRKSWLKSREPGDDDIEAPRPGAIGAGGAAPPSRVRGFGDPLARRREVHRHAERNRQLWANHAIQRHWLEGEEKVMARHDPALARQAQVQRQDGPTATVDSVKFTPNEVPADGTTTAQGKATTSGGASVSKWSILGEGFGSAVDGSGLLTPGTDIKGAESAPVQVEARDEAAGAAGTGSVTLWDAKLWQAKIDFPKFISAPLSYPNFEKGLNGKFDVDYDPSARVAKVTMKLKFSWPEADTEPSMWNLWGLLTSAASLKKQEDYQANFIKQVMKQWSGRYEFQNIREPKSIWSKLNPVTVAVNIVPVDSGQHFTVEIRDRAADRTKGEANQVGGGVLTLYQGADVPKPAFNPDTAAGELKRVDRVTPTPIQFENNSAVIPPGDLAKLGTMGTYISRINNPKFDIKVEGHASATGKSSENMTLSEQRAKAVVDALKAAGATNHTITHVAHGDTGATKDDAWRKVVITNSIPAGWQNMQDTTAHEFGHMIGLGDEYAKAGVPKATHYDLVAKAFGPDYAEQVAKRGDTDYASIMDGGDDVRIQHYVTFWSALVETTLKAAVPDPKFGYDDWKFVGT